MNKQNSKTGPKQPSDIQLKKCYYNSLKTPTQYSNTQKSRQSVAGNYNTTNILEKKLQNDAMQIADVDMQ
ncbi:11031_t:CDS:2 [Racocetra persica]|uniref:11031_t:CDS:1 n=1 Tax=Racocetra persica TaxID=160502 RepID=A0ACA9M575_9GLOM|nr:11031_t:CDS:2 [Racocetra persica]